MSSRDERENLQQAFSLHRSGNFAEAAKLYRKIIRKNPRQPHALHSLGIIESAAGNTAEAASLMARSLAVDTTNVPFAQNYATVLCQLGQYEAASSVCLKALQLDDANQYLLYVAAGALHKQGRLRDALASFDRLLTQEPRHVAGLTERSAVLLALKQPDHALQDTEKAISLDARYAEAYLGAGNIYAHLKRYDDALRFFEAALKLNSALDRAWLGRGNVFLDLKRTQDASDSYVRALSINPKLAEAWLGQGSALFDIKRYDEAFQAYDKAMSLDPNSPAAWLGRGNVLLDRKRYDDALAAYEKALAGDPTLATAWLGCGNVLCSLKKYQAAFAAYDKALAIDAELAAAWLGRGNVFCSLKNYGAAQEEYTKAVSLKPDMAEVWLGRGNILFELSRYKDALAAFDTAISLKPDFLEAWLGRGNALADIKGYHDAFAAYDKAMSLDPDFLAVEGQRLHAKMQICDWKNFDADSSHLVKSVRAGKKNTTPFVFLGVSSSAEDQLTCAKAWVGRQFPETKPSRSLPPYRHDKIRLGYVSADFRQHPVAELACGIFDHHDRSQFEVIGISVGPDDKSQLRQRLENAFDKFIDAAALDTNQIEEIIKQEEIDILVDLNGLTRGARTDIFARRCAPIQVNYLGYAGTMGADYIDYIIADPVVIPASQHSAFVEKIVYLPHSYMPHDDKSRPNSRRPFDRAEFGLPARAFVFCCFNNAYKFNPAIFATWMRLLKAVDGSVLWLAENNAATAENLRGAALAADIDPARLIFAKRVPSSADHLARHALADLFLDTLPYNAHATASDALWAGLPVLTLIGETFAGRVAASLLTAVGLPELIAHSTEQFESMAIELATRPGRMEEIKDKLDRNRSTSPLFDTNSFTRDIERAYAGMYRRHREGLLPDHIYVEEQIKV